METCSCICIPKGEKGEMEIIASAQDLKGLQQCCAGVLNIPANRITTKVKRLGISVEHSFHVQNAFTLQVVNCIITGY